MSCPRPSTTARTAGGPFSPSRPRQGLNHRDYSPQLLTQLVAAAVAAVSFEEAARLLERLVQVSVSPRHLQTLAHEIGDELAEGQQEQTRDFQAQTLQERRTPRRAAPPIPLAAVMPDGGRMQTRGARRPTGVHDPHWRETKAAVLLRMTDAAGATDPHPALPRCFAHPTLAGAATEEAAGADPQTDAASDSPVEDPTSVDASAPTERWGPESLVRTGIATLDDSEGFGWRLAAEAERRGFFSAAKRAFVGDGQAYNWSIQRSHFPDFTPVLDFAHAAEHAHAAAKAIGDPRLGRLWAEACWQGRVAAVITEIRAARDQREPPAEPAAEPEHPWCVLNQAAGYFAHNQERMDYPRYRREGLPITSSPVESWIKQLNQRVKGSERFWEDGRRGEAILQLRAAWLGEDNRLERHLASRPGHPYARPRPTHAQAA